MNINRDLCIDIRRLIEAEDGSNISDLHVWRLGPGHFGAIVSILTNDPRPPSHYKELLRDLEDLCHITVEINPEHGKIASK
jgi:Co/Zn/Cd efflux system component